MTFRGGGYVVVKLLRRDPGSACSRTPSVCKPWTARARGLDPGDWAVGLAGRTVTAGPRGSQGRRGWVWVGTWVVGTHTWGSEIIWLRGRLQAPRHPPWRAHVNPRSWR